MSLLLDVIDDDESKNSNEDDGKSHTDSFEAEQIVTKKPQRPTINFNDQSESAPDNS